MELPATHRRAILTRTGRCPRRPAAALRALSAGLVLSFAAIPLSIQAFTGTEVDTLAALTADVLQLDQTARAAETPRDDDAGLTRIYVGDRVDGLLLRWVRAQLDEQPPREYEYSEAEAQALAHGGLHQLFDTALSSGTHRLRIEFTARTAQALPSDARVKGLIDQTFAAGGEARWLEAELIRQGLVSKQTMMKLRAVSPLNGVEGLASDDPQREHFFVIGSDDDPRLRQVRLLLAEDRALAAASELLQLREHSTEALPATFSAQLAEVISQLGLSAGATGRSDALAADTQAYAAKPDPDLSSAADFEDYDSAVAQLGGDGAAAAVATLTRLGQGKWQDAAGLGLRDQANLSLGYHQLHNHQASAAIESFLRVRAQGPFATRGLLALGWAYLAGDGEAAPSASASMPANAGTDANLRPDFIRDIEHQQQRDALHGAPPSSAQARALRRALVPWTELIGRNPMDPAVQEGLLAIAYAFNHSGAFADAQRFYLRAIKLLDTTRERLEAAATQVNNGSMLAAIARGSRAGADSGWHWQLPDVPVDSHWWLTLNDDPQAPDNFYFEQLLANADFNEVLADYQRLQLLAACVDGHLQALAQTPSAAGELPAHLAALKPRIDAAQAARAQRLQQVALADLRRQKKQADDYWVEAQFALARSNDWAMEVAHQ